MPDQNKEKDSFPITYHVKHHEEPISKDDVPHGYGVSDSLLIMSKIFMPDGTKDYAFLALDGNRGDNMTPQEVFEAWVVLAGMLKDNLPMGDVRKDLCMDVLKIVYDLFDNPQKQVEPQERKLIVPGSKEIN